MKRTFLLASFLLLSFALFAQLNTLTEFNQDRLQKQKTSMLILGGWAIGNMAAGAMLFRRYEDDRRYFHLMNIGWNTVNLSLATLGYLAASNTDPASFDMYQTVNEQYKMQKIFLFNAGLDVGYMLGGLYLMERSKNAAKRPDLLKGFGRSIILQGAFLFAFDLGAYFLQATNNKALAPLLSNIHFQGDQIGLVLNF